VEKNFKTSTTHRNIVIEKSPSFVTCESIVFKNDVLYFGQHLRKPSEQIGEIRYYKCAFILRVHKKKNILRPEIFCVRFNRLFKLGMKIYHVYRPPFVHESIQRPFSLENNLFII